jgi:lysozyme
MELDSLLEELKDEEGFRAFVYDDATGIPIKKGYTCQGNPTIGYGWNCAASPMSESEAALVLGNRIIGAAKAAANLVPNWLSLNDIRQNVLIDMCFNLGTDGLRAFKKMLAAANEGRFDDAANEMKDSAWYVQVKGRGPLLESRMRTGKTA